MWSSGPKTDDFVTAILAVLIIAHPDPEYKFKNWIGRLQIDWMMTQDRNTLDVKSGFWKGLNSKNLDTAFALDTAEDSRRAEGPLHADYTSIFGPKFMSCRRDIRSFVPHGEKLELAMAPSDVEDDDVFELASDGAAGEAPVPSSPTEANGTVTVAVAPFPGPDDPGKPVEVSSDGTIRLYELLTAAGPEPEPHVLEQWLIQELEASDGDGDILAQWCKHWQRRVTEAHSYRDQTIIRSLFHLSLNRLMALQRASKSLAAGFMLSDMEQWDASHPETVVKEAVAAIGDLLPFGPCKTANDKLAGLVNHEASQAARDLVPKVFMHQTVFLFRFAQSSPFFKYWDHVFTLEALYTSVIIEGHKRATATQDSRGSELQFWRSKMDILLSEDVIKALCLQSWQIRALLLPGPDIPVLTKWQSFIFRQMFCPEFKIQCNIDMYDLRPQPVIHANTYPAAIRARHAKLHELLGEIKMPQLDFSSEVLPAEATWVPSSISLTKSSPGQASMPISPLQRRPSFASSSTQDLTLGNEARKSNPFTGQLATSTKRRCSPALVQRSSKNPRLGLTRDELGEELHGLRADFNSELERLRLGLPSGDIAGALHSLGADISSDGNKLKEELGAMRADFRTTLGQIAADLRSDMKQSRTEFRDLLRAEIQADLVADDGLTARIKAESEHSRAELQSAMHAETKSVLDADNELKSSVTSHLDRLRADIIGGRTEADEQLRSAVNLAVEQLGDSLIRSGTKNVEDVNKRLGRMEDLISKLGTDRSPKQLGMPGYLKRCPAPESWQSTQQAYESSLLHAGWMYISALGHPEDGCSEDEGAWDLVTAAFPAVLESHLLIALDHAHMQGYGRPLRRVSTT